MFPTSTQRRSYYESWVTMKSFANLSRLTIVTIILAILSGGCATVPLEPPNTPEARLAEAMVGDYGRAVTSGSVVEPIRDQRIKIDALGPGEWLYHQRNAGPDLSQITRRRVLSLRAQPDGRVIQADYTVPAPKSQQATQQWLTTLTRDQLRPAMNTGCDMIWVEMPNGWSGQIDPARCRMTPPAQTGEHYLGARADLVGSRLRTAETGYDEDGNRLWGEDDGQWVVLDRTP